jgi:acyl-CoA synthetase (AMP-forming)/AMP-acid ligase II
MSTPDDAIAPLELPLDGVVAHWAARRPQELALEYDEQHGRSITWAELEHFVRGTAADLGARVAPLQTVGVVCEDSVDFHVLINALWRRRASVLLINRNWGRAVVEDLVRLTHCALVFGRNWGVSLGADSAECVPFPALRSAAGAPDPDVRGRADDVAMFATTSGTTDDPKCVPIRHRQIRQAYRTCLAIHDFRDVRKAGSLFPLNGIGVMGVCFLLPREIGAATKVFPPFSMANIARSWRELLAGDVGFVYLVPALVRLLISLPPTGARSAPLLAFCAAAPVHLGELLRLERKFPVRVFNAYGLTEVTFAVFFGCRDENGAASDSIGTARGIDARLVDEDGRTLHGAGRGELYLKGPMLTDGYLRNPRATSETWIDGWLKTGDLAERDHAGRYYIRGRLKDAVVRGGILYYLGELEHYIRRAPGVVDACAFKGRDLPSGDELCVVAQVDGATDHARILDWLRDNVGEEKVPNVLVVWTDPLPRNSNGKILRGALAESYLAGELVPRRMNVGAQEHGSST